MGKVTPANAAAIVAACAASFVLGILAAEHILDPSSPKTGPKESIVASVTNAASCVTRRDELQTAALNVLDPKLKRWNDLEVSIGEASKPDLDKERQDLASLRSWTAKNVTDPCVSEAYNEWFDYWGNELNDSYKKLGVVARVRATTKTLPQPPSE